MTTFTTAEARAIVEAAEAGPEAGLQRLTELFGAGTLALASAAQAADRLRAGEAVSLGGGEYLQRDHGPTGRVLGRS
jgi:hypothetical protein